jgi:hypothetical protein
MSAGDVDRILSSLRARIATLEKKGGDGGAGHEELFYISDTWPILHDLTERYREPRTQPSLGLNGHWKISSLEVPRVSGSGVRNGKRWSLEFEEHSPGVATVEAYLCTGNECSRWNSGTHKSTSSLVTKLNAYFQG